MKRKSWYLAVNTFTPGAAVAPGTVLSAHRSLLAAEAACRAAQPRERGSYLPTMVVVSDRWYRRGTILDREDVQPTCAWCGRLGDVRDTYAEPSHEGDDHDVVALCGPCRDRGGTD